MLVLRARVHAAAVVDERQGTSRVAPGISPRGSHGSGRADFPHPALRASRFAARRHRRVPCGRGRSTRSSPVSLSVAVSLTLPGREVPFVFPYSGSTARLPLPSAGFLGVGSPASQVLRGAPTSCHPSRCPSFPSDTRYCLRRLVRSFVRHGATVEGLGCKAGCPFPHTRRETTGPPRFLGTPRQRAALSDSGGTSAPSNCGAPVQSSAQCTASTPATRNYFEAQSHGLLTPCVRFAAAVTDGHATLGSGRLPTVAGRAWPAGVRRRFQLSIASSFAKLPWRTHRPIKIVQ